MTFTDSVLRALAELDAAIKTVDDNIYDPLGSVIKRQLRSARTHTDALAAAEAAPLDSTRLGEAFEGIVGEHWPAETWRAIAREYAALAATSREVRCSIPACNGLHSPDHPHVAATSREARND